MTHKEDWEVKVAYVYREGNQAADWIANFGVSFIYNVFIFDNRLLLVVS